MNLLNKLFVWVSNKAAQSKEQQNKEALVYPVSKTDKVYDLVSAKIAGFENELVLTRIHSLEKVVMQLTHQVLVLAQENKLQRELLLYTSTNIEELMNYFGEASFMEDDSDEEPEVVLVSKNNNKLNIN